MTPIYTQFSKQVSYALRHNPQAFGISLDKDGWVLIDDLLTALNKRNTLQASIADIYYIIDHSEKKRFEIKDDKWIRATYGHSAIKIEFTPADPPPILYHGTSNTAWSEYIAYDGLKPMNRKYVHLSSDYGTAVKVGSRHDKHPVILTVDAATMHKDGFQFFHSANDGTWMVGSVPRKYIQES